MDCSRIVNIARMAGLPAPGMVLSDERCWEMVEHCRRVLIEKSRSWKFFIWVCDSQGLAWEPRDPTPIPDEDDNDDISDMNDPDDGGIPDGEDPDPCVWEPPKGSVIPIVLKRSCLNWRPVLHVVSIFPIDEDYTFDDLEFGMIDIKRPLFYCEIRGVALKDLKVRLRSLMRKKGGK